MIDYGTQLSELCPIYYFAESIGVSIYKPNYRVANKKSKLCYVTFHRAEK